MKLTPQQQAALDGSSNLATRKAMQILTTLGEIYGADRLIPVSSVQVAGVSYDNLGDAGLDFLTELANNGGKARVLATLNPAGMDRENWQALGISESFARNQIRVLEAFSRMGILTTCSCTPYLFGNLPCFGEHIAWSESSAVCFANSVLGARTNREGGPSALASALTGYTPNYGMHLDSARAPAITIEVESGMQENHTFGALGMVIGRRLESIIGNKVAYITGIHEASLENLKSFCASLATFGGAAMFHMAGITPEASKYAPPNEIMSITQADLAQAIQMLNNDDGEEIDFFSLGCPHLSIREIARIAGLIKGRKTNKEFWITTARPTRMLADQMGYSQMIEESGIKFAVDTCCVVAPIKNRFKVMATDSAKACYYANAKNKFKIRLMPFDQVVEEAFK